MNLREISSSASKISLGAVTAVVCSLLLTASLFGQPPHKGKKWAGGPHSCHHGPIVVVPAGPPGHYHHVGPPPWAPAHGYRALQHGVHPGAIGKHRHRGPVYRPGPPHRRPPHGRHGRVRGRAGVYVEIDF